MEIRIVLPPNDTVLVRKYFNIRLVYSALIFYDVVEHVLNVYISVLLVGIGGHPVEVFQKMAQRFLNRSSIKYSSSNNSSISIYFSSLML